MKLAIGKRHFEEAFARVPPSVSARDQRRYLSMRASLSRVRSSGSGNAAAAGGGEGGETEVEKKEGEGEGEGEGGGEGMAK